MSGLQPEPDQADIDVPTTNCRRIKGEDMRMMRTICIAVALALIASHANAAIIDWQAELQRCRELRASVAPLLQAGEGISAVGRSNRSVRRCIWIQRMAVRKKIPGAETW